MRPFLITEEDRTLLGNTNRSDPLGILVVWSMRGRDLVPHLTEQTTKKDGFKVLVEIFRLWELYEVEYPNHVERLSDFFLLMEQVFARTMGSEWTLPGTTRIEAQKSEVVRVSLKDPRWHLLGAQRSNGLWGLYRGAAERAGILKDERLESSTHAIATEHALLSKKEQTTLFEQIHKAMNGETVSIDLFPKKTLKKIYKDKSIETHLRECFFSSGALCTELALRTKNLGNNEKGLQRRIFIEDMCTQLPAHKTTLEHVVACENLLAPLEHIFFWVSQKKGLSIESIASCLSPIINLSSLQAAQEKFSKGSGDYKSKASKKHYQYFCTLKMNTTKELIEGLILIHKKICIERGRSPWMWLENGMLKSDISFPSVQDKDLEVGVAWRNDYYLWPLKTIGEQFGLCK